MEDTEMISKSETTDSREQAHVLLCAPAQQFAELVKGNDLCLDDATYLIDCLSDGIEWLGCVVGEVEKLKAPGPGRDLVDGVISLRRAGESLRVTHHLLGTANRDLLAALHAQEIRSGGTTGGDHLEGAAGADSRSGVERHGQRRLRGAAASL
jgi:hypothetical protein